MRTFPLLPILALLSAGCSGQGSDPFARNDSALTNSGADDQAAAPGTTRWDLQSSGEGVALALLGGSRETVLRLFCPAGERRLLVNVPAFRPVGSEERMSIGSGGEAVALVADSRGDRQRGGVSGAGPVPDNLPELIGGRFAVNYGSQNSGPHAAPAAQQTRAFAAACADAPPAEGGPAAPPGQPPVNEAGVGACRLQDGRVLPPNRLKAIGTEPFWAARIEGRCVTYSHPENQSGTRIWAQFTGSRDSGVWTGFYQNRRFVLRTRRAPGCSDGMSDQRYPVGVTLVIGGEERIGCAEWL